MNPYTRTGRPAKPYFYQFCGTGCRRDDLLIANVNRDTWRERIEGIRYTHTHTRTHTHTHIYIYIYIYIYIRYVPTVHCRTVRSQKQESSVWLKTASDGEAPVILELWGMQSTPSLSLLPRPLSLYVVAPDWVLSMSLIELFDI